METTSKNPTIPKVFVPYSGNPNLNGVRQVAVSNGLNAVASFGMSIPTPIINSSDRMVMMSNQPNPPIVSNQPIVSDSNQPIVSNSITSEGGSLPNEPLNIPLVNLMKDVIFHMVINVESMRSNLNKILNTPSMITIEINKCFIELKDKITQNELDKLNNSLCNDTSKTNIISVLETAFNNILHDGKIDMNDAPYFLELVHNFVTIFTTNKKNVSVSNETIVLFLHFVLKCIIILILNNDDEQQVLNLLDKSFELVKLTIPFKSKWCCCF